jgi:hypothetical protein
VRLFPGDKLLDTQDPLHPRGVVIGVNERYATILWAGGVASIILQGRLPNGWRLVPEFPSLG